jgi:hypothetical protein
MQRERLGRIMYNRRCRSPVCVLLTIRDAGRGMQQRWDVIRASFLSPRLLGWKGCACTGDITGSQFRKSGLLEKQNVGDRTWAERCAGVAQRAVRDAVDCDRIQSSCRLATTIAAADWLLSTLSQPL